MAEDVLDEENRGGKRFGRDVNGRGVIFRPVVGNGIFWVNLERNGPGDERVLHVGLPVKKGSKIGLNFWVTKLESPI